MATSRESKGPIDISEPRQRLVLQMREQKFRFPPGNNGSRRNTAPDILESLDRAVGVVSPRVNGVVVSRRIPDHVLARPFKQFESRRQFSGDYERVTARNEKSIFLRPPPSDIEGVGARSARNTNLEWRQAVEVLTEHSVDWRRYIRWVCSREITTWFNGFIVGLDPREGREAPFVLYPAQREALERMNDIIWGDVNTDREFFIEKLSRDEGGSYLLAAVFVYHWLFRDRVSFGLLCLSMDKVDDGTTNSLMGKVKHILRWMPHVEIMTKKGKGFNSWMIGPGWTGSDRNRQKMMGRVAYPTPNEQCDPNCTITGYPTTSDAFVGPRFTAIGIDESAVIDTAADSGHSVEDIVGFARSATKTIIHVSTHRGVHTYFARRLSDVHAPRAVLHWSDNEDKNGGMHSRLWTTRDSLKAQASRYALDLKMQNARHRDPMDWIRCWKRRIGTKSGKSRYRDERIEGGAAAEKQWSPWYFAECEARINANPSKEEAMIRTELDGVPSATGTCAFDPNKLRHLMRARLNEKEPVRGRVVLSSRGKTARFLAGPGNVTVWEEPQKGHKYLTCTDTAFGVGRDYSVTDVWKITGDNADDPFVQVAQYHDNQSPPREHGDVTAALTCWYNDGYTINESNLGGGSAMLDRLLEERRDRGLSFKVYKRQRMDTVTRKINQDVPGWETVRGTRDRVVMSARDLFDTDQVIINSQATLKDMMAFELSERNKWEAATGEHDDCVIVLGLLKIGMEQFNRGLCALMPKRRSPSRRSRAARQARSIQGRCAVSGY